MVHALYVYTNAHKSSPEKWNKGRWRRVAPSYTGSSGRGFRCYVLLLFFFFSLSLFFFRSPHIARETACFPTRSALARPPAPRHSSSAPFTNVQISSPGPRGNCLAYYPGKSPPYTRRLGKLNSVPLRTDIIQRIPRRARTQATRRARSLSGTIVTMPSRRYGDLI